MARPSSYSPAILPVVRACATFGATAEEIANYLNIPWGSFKRWIYAEPELREALKRGRDASDERVVESLYRKALDRRCRRDLLLAEEPTPQRMARRAASRSGRGHYIISDRPMTEAEWIAERTKVIDATPVLPQSEGIAGKPKLINGLGDKSKRSIGDKDNELSHSLPMGGWTQGGGMGAGWSRWQGGRLRVLGIAPKTKETGKQPTSRDTAIEFSPDGKSWQRFLSNMGDVTGRLIGWGSALVLTSLDVVQKSLEVDLSDYEDFVHPTHPAKTVRGASTIWRRVAADGNSSLSVGWVIPMRSG